MVMNLLKKAFTWYYKNYYQVYKPIIDAGVNPTL